MSVLNQMLRDLENRGASHALAAAGGSAGSHAQVAVAARPRMSRLTAGLAAALGVSALLAGSYAWLEQRTGAATMSRPPLGSSQYGPALAADASGGTAPGLPAATTAAAPAAPAAPAGPPAAAAPAAAVAAPALVESPVAATGATLAGDETRTAVQIVIDRAPGPTGAAPQPALKTAAAAPQTQRALAPQRAGPMHGTAAEPAATHHTAPAVAPPAASGTDAAADGAGSTMAPGGGVVARAPVAAQRAELDRAADLIAHGRSSEAIGLLRQVLAKNPQHLLARRTLVALLAEGGQRDQALASLLEGTAVAPAEFALSAAQMQAEAGDVEGALQTLARMPPEARSARHDALAAGLSQRLGRHEAAVAAYQSALRHSDPNPVWWVGLAISLEALGQEVDAQAAYRQAAAQPGLPDAIRQFVAQKTAAMNRGAQPPAAAAH